MLTALDGNRELMRELIVLFIDGVAARLPALAMAVESGDAPALGRLAHGLRGSVANFSTGAAYRAAARLEEMAGAGELADAPLELRRLRRGLERLIGAMREFDGAGRVPSSP